MRKGYLRQAWLVIALCAAFGAALAGVNAALGPVIEKNLKMESQRLAPDVLLGPAGSEAQRAERLATLRIEELEIPVGNGERTTRYEVYRVSTAGGVLLGWVAKAEGKGFADRIELLVGLDPNGHTIRGLDVVYQNETPGLGSHIKDAAWRGQFAEKPTEKRLSVTKTTPGAGQILAITGATISSESVSSIVNRVTRDLREPLSQRAGQYVAAHGQGAADGR